MAGDPARRSVILSLGDRRGLFIGGFLVCVVLMAAALWFEHVGGLEPCPLCMLQRLFVVAVGALFLLGALHGPRGVGRRVYGGLIALSAGLGGAVAARHVWLQSLPPERVPECGPGLDYLLGTFPFSEALSLVLQGSGECAEVDWTFLGLSMPAWTLAFFVGLAVAGVFLLVVRRPAVAA